MNTKRTIYTLIISTFLSIITGMWIVISLAGCKSTTKPEPSGIITGRVICENDTGNPSFNIADNSGVTVSLYNITELDTALVRINEIHPGIGVKIDQETEFDHRVASPIATTETNASGSYTIGNIPFGLYNIAIYKENWAVKYIYNVQVYSSSTVTMPENLLHPARILSDYITGAYTFEAGETHIANNQTIFTDPVTIESGARIYVGHNGSLSFYSTVTSTTGKSSDRFWRIDSSIGLYSSAVIVIDPSMYFPSIAFNGNVPYLSNGLVRHISDGLSFNSGQNNVSEIDLKKYNSGLSFNSAGGVVNRINIRDGSNKAIQGLSQNDALTVTKCILYKGLDGIIAYVSGGFTIEDCYFYSVTTAVLPQNCTGVIQYNNFYNNSYDILQYLSPCTITKNNFYYTKSTSITPRRTAIINANNFYKTHVYFVDIRRSDGSHTLVNQDIDATGNYWAVDNIPLYIRDAADNIDYPGAEIPYYVNYLPKSNSKITSAGIRN